MLRPIFVHKWAFHRPTIPVILELKSAFDSVDHWLLWRYFTLWSVQEKFIFVICMQATDSESMFTIVFHSIPLRDMAFVGAAFLHLFSFIAELVMKIVPFSCKNNGNNIHPNRKMSDLEYADDVMVLGIDSSKFHVFLNRLGDGGSMFGIRFAPLRCKMLFQDWLSSEPNLVLARQNLDAVDKLLFVCSLLSSLNVECSILRYGKVLLTSTKLRHLWCWYNLRSSIKMELTKQQ